MTPGNFLMKMWSSIHEICPDIKFQLVPFDNTPENAKEILKNLGNKIDIVAGSFDDNFLNDRKCSGLALSYEPIRCAVSVYNELSKKNSLKISDLYGKNFMLIKRGWNICTDKIRDDIIKNHPEINIIDFDFINLTIFNQCENSNDLLMCIDDWANAHPLLKVLPVNWDYKIQFGLLHSKEPSETVTRFLNAVKQIKDIT